MRIVREDMDTINNYIQLASAIVRNAAQDYVDACTGLKKDPNNWRLKNKRDECVYFFKSRNFEIFSLGADPDYTIRKLDELVENGERIVTNIGARHKLSPGIDDEYTMTDEEYAASYKKL